MEHLNPNAADLLRLCAFLHPEGIPLRAIAVTTIELGPLLPSTIADQYALNEAIAVLRAASLLHRNADEQTLTIHRLVQAIVKDSMNEDEQRKWAERAVRFVNDACSDLEKMMRWLRGYRSFPHESISAALLNCVALIDQWNLMFEEAARLLYLGGAYFLACKQDKLAETLLLRAQTIQERLGELSFPDIPVLLEQYALLLATLEHSEAKLSPSWP